MVLVDFFRFVLLVMFGYSINPETFLENHLSVFERIMQETKGLMPVYKWGDRYYVNPSVFFDLSLSEHFRDGILMPNDVRKTATELLDLLKRDFIRKIYPIMTNADSYKYKVLYKDKQYGPYYVITSDSLITIYVAKRLFKNIRDILEYKKSVERKRKEREDV